MSLSLGTSLFFLLAVGGGSLRLEDHPLVVDVVWEDDGVGAHLRAAAGPVEKGILNIKPLSNVLLLCAAFNVVRLSFRVLPLSVFFSTDPSALRLFLILALHHPPGELQQMPDVVHAVQVVPDRLARRRVVVQAAAVKERCRDKRTKSAIMSTHLTQR